ncbi:hypothetical protein BKA61DRAFT_183682 [Leptodontidium sp. MPI-SDFR-AT-0119]|nr:hypothetical protein BKA61DRAFT_183682 [Leptodontidium sp. MPI-SDFR-AT-0119]
MLLNELATELLTEIFLHLDSNPSWKSLALCSKRLHAIVEPLLYSKVHLIKSQKSCLMYIRSISTNPHLVQHVRDFHTYDGSDYDMQPLPTQERAWMRQTLPDNVYGEAVCDEWFSQMFSLPGVNNSHRRYDAFIAFLLNLFRHTLESLHMWFHWYNPYDYSHISRVLEQAALEQSTKGSEASLSRLRTVALRQMDWPIGRSPFAANGIPCRVFIPFLNLPSVRNFRGLKLCSEDRSLLYNENQNSIVDITINEALIEAVSMSSFLSMFRQLKRVEYQHATLYFEDLPIFRSRMFIRGLRHSKDTLEEVVVSNYPDDSVEGPGKPLSWASFTKLRSITADVCILAGADILVPPNPQPGDTSDATNPPNTTVSLHTGADFDALSDDEPEAGAEMLPRQFTQKQSLAFASYFPPSLEHLTILKCQSSVFDLVEALLSPNNPGFPCSLKTFRLIFAQDPRTVPQLRWDEAQKQAAWGGIQISWSMLNFQDKTAVDRVVGRKSRFELAG